MSADSIINDNARFWSKVDASGDCWEWCAGRTHDGYGQYHVGKNKKVYAHRFAYQLLIGEIPTGLQLDHRCRNRACVSPAHLEPVTQSENARRSTHIFVLRRYMTHCKRGHAFTPDNIYRNSIGARVCRQCDRVRQSRRMRANAPVRHTQRDAPPAQRRA